MLLDQETYSSSTRNISGNQTHTWYFMRVGHLLDNNEPKHTMQMQ